MNILNTESISPSVFTVAVYTQLEVGTQRPFQDIEEEELTLGGLLMLFSAQKDGML